MELWVVSHLIQQENQQRKFWIPHMRYRGFTLGKPFPSLQAEARACLVAPLMRDLLSYLSLSPQSEVCTSARHTCTCEKEMGAEFQFSWPMVTVSCGQSQHVIIAPNCCVLSEVLHTYKSSFYSNNRLVGQVLFTIMSQARKLRLDSKAKPSCSPRDLVMNLFL